MKNLHAARRALWKFKFAVPYRSIGSDKDAVCHDCSALKFAELAGRACGKVKVGAIQTVTILKVSSLDCVRACVLDSHRAVPATGGYVGDTTQHAKGHLRLRA